MIERFSTLLNTASINARRHAGDVVGVADVGIEALQGVPRRHCEAALSGRYRDEAVDRTMSADRDCI